MYAQKYHKIDLSKFSFLITGGAGFIGSNLVEYLLKHGAKKVSVLDNFATGHKKNISSFFSQDNFELIEGDIRSLEICNKACEGIDFVFHQAALGSVPRSIEDPKTTNEVNISGFMNMLIASRDNKVKRFIYAASSSTYGDSNGLPKVEEKIGKPLSPYAITKYVNELYADIFSSTFNMETIGLRYFNVFGQKQDPNGAYAAVIPKFIMELMQHKSPIVNGDGEYSRDFTYIDNVVQINMLCLNAKDVDTINQVYNVAFGERTTLNQLVEILKKNLSKFDDSIKEIDVVHGPIRKGDIPHSLASIQKAKQLLNYSPSYSIQEGLEEAIEWYWNNLLK